jgi:hypothetical protein
VIRIVYLCHNQIQSVLQRFVLKPEPRNPLKVLQSNTFKGFLDSSNRKMKDGGALRRHPSFRQVEREWIQCDLD